MFVDTCMSETYIEVNEEEKRWKRFKHCFNYDNYCGCFMSFFTGLGTIYLLNFDGQL